MKKKTEKNKFPIKLFLNHLIDFSYVINPENQSLQATAGLTRYLNHASELHTLIEVLHPNEKKKLLRLEKETLAFAKAHSFYKGEFGIAVMHQMKKAKGNYIKVLRHIYPFVHAETNQILLYAYCMDVSWLQWGDKISFRVLKSDDAEFDVETVQDHFATVLTDEAVYFTERQLEVLRLWSEYDSPKKVAEKLNMKVRTLETHLRNARKKMGARRTLDVVLYAKEQGWL